MSLEEQFNQVAQSVTKWSTTPPNDQNLALYSLYKQAVAGDVNISEPSDIVGKAKYAAWVSRKGLSSDEAKKQYIAMAEQLQSKYA